MAVKNYEEGEKEESAAARVCKTLKDFGVEKVRFVSFEENWSCSGAAVTVCKMNFISLVN